MKKLAYIALCGLGLFCSCSSSDDEVSGGGGNRLEISRETVNFANSASSGAVAVTSNGSWNAAVSEGGSWITVSPESGTGNGEFLISAGDNSDGDTRSGKVTVTQTHNGTTERREITVAQLGANSDILLEYSSDLIPYQGGTFTVTVTSNIEWEVFIDEEYDWIVPVESKAFSSESREFLIEANGGLERTGEIVFRATDGMLLSKTAVVTQQVSEAYLSLPTDEFYLPYRYQTLTIPIDLGEKGVHIDVDTGADWITYDEAASSVDRIVLKIGDNDASDLPRTAQVTITNVTLQETVKVFQYGRPNPRIGDDPTVDALAFPGAEGGGRLTTGGRGGQVLYVTSLEDDGSVEGTLRWALNQNYPRTILFAVSGIIDLKSQLNIPYGNVTIAGQSAPGDGICLRNNTLYNGASNVIVRFIRSRMGDLFDVENDAMWGRRCNDIILDHLSLSWSTDECASFYDNANFTMQWCILSESLKISVHGKGSHGYGGIWGGQTASFHHNMLAHHDSRNPRMCGSRYTDRPDLELVDFRNNVVFNWGGNSSYAGEGGRYNFVNNYYRPTAGSSNSARIFLANSDDGSNQQPEGVWGEFHLSGNYMTLANGQVNSTVTDNNINGLHVNNAERDNPAKTPEDIFSPTEFQVPYVTTHDAVTAFHRVVDYVGASLFRDEVDARVTREAFTGEITFTDGGNGSTGGLIDTQEAVGGWPPYLNRFELVDSDGDGIPDIWEDAYGLDKNDPTDAAAFTLDEMGRYSNLEVYLHNLVQHIVYYQNLP